MERNSLVRGGAFKCCGTGKSVVCTVDKRKSTFERVRTGTTTKYHYENRRPPFPLRYQTVDRVVITTRGVAFRTMDSVHGLKDPQTLVFQRPAIRRLILASYWVVILLAVPFWWRLTSIERRPLRVHSQLDRTPVFPVNVRLDAPTFQEKASFLANELNSLLADSTRRKGLEIHVGVAGTVLHLCSLCMTMHPVADGQRQEGSYTVAVGNATAVSHPRHLTVSHEDALHGRCT